jgi:hypothetical protein
MKYIINNLQKIYFILFSLFILGIIFVQFNIVEISSVIGHLIPLIMLINLIQLFLLCRDKIYNKISKNSLTATIFSVISFFIFLILTKLKLINPLLGYVFVYLVFPNMILIFLSRDKKNIIVRNHLKKSFIWLLILIIGIILNKYKF